MSNELVKADQYLNEIDYARKVGEMIVGSGKWSKDYNKETVALLVMYAKEIGIHPVKALMCGFDIIQGKITMKPMMMNDMIRKAGHSIQVEQNDDKACIIKGKRRDNADTCTIKFTIEDAKKAGLTGKDNYAKWTSNMLYARAMGNLARMLFADVVGGVYMDGELDPAPHHQKNEPMPITIETIEEMDMETGEYTQTYTIEDLFEKVQIGTIEKLREYVKLISIKMKDFGWKDESDAIQRILSDSDMLEDFKRKLAKTIQPQEAPQE